MRLSLCNEVLVELPFREQCELAAALGYEGLELAPYTFSDDPPKLDAAARREIRRTAEAAGLVVSGLHWLLVKPDGLSLTDPDAGVRARTIAAMRALATLCGELGGDVLVHGSPAQRRLPDDPAEAATARAWALEGFAAAGDAAAAAGVVYCIEPLAPPNANFITTVAEAVGIVGEIANPHLRTMIDTGAARANPDEASIESLIADWVPGGEVSHIQFRDRTRCSPGLGEDRFAGIVAALDKVGYRDWVAMEPIDLAPSGIAVAAHAAGYLKGLRERGVSE